MQTGDVALDFDYFLPKDHGRRTGNPEYMKRSQIDPFQGLASMCPDEDTDEHGYTGRDSPRVFQCPGTVDDTLAFKSYSNENGASQLQDTLGRNEPPRK